jgi:hypothetical protein
MGAVFASATRAPLTSLASVVEMTGDFSLTLPVMLAVAIATAVSRMLSYGTIYTTKLLRRGTDIDRMTPWRALRDLKVSDAMRPFRPPLDLPPLATAAAADGSDGTPDWVALPGYQVIELTVSAASPAVGARLGAIRWPPGTVPVSVLRDHTHRGPDPAVTLRPDDRISLLVPAAAEPAEPSASPT